MEITLPYMKKPVRPSILSLDASDQVIRYMRETGGIRSMLDYVDTTAYIFMQQLILSTASIRGRVIKKQVPELARSYRMPEYIKYPDLITKPLLNSGLIKDRGPVYKSEIEPADVRQYLDDILLKARPHDVALMGCTFEFSFTPMPLKKPHLYLERMCELNPQFSSNITGRYDPIRSYRAAYFALADSTKIHPLSIQNEYFLAGPRINDEKIALKLMKTDVASLFTDICESPGAGFSDDNISELSSLRAIGLIDFVSDFSLLPKMHYAVSREFWNRLSREFVKKKDVDVGKFVAEPIVLALGRMRRYGIVKIPGEVDSTTKRGEMLVIKPLLELECYEQNGKISDFGKNIKSILENARADIKEKGFHNMLSMKKIIKIREDVARKLWNKQSRKFGLMKYL